jgi:DNA adenine methylase
MFLAIRPQRSRLADLNSNLIDTFCFVRDEPALVHRYLRFHARRDSKSHYYEVRDQYNNVAQYSAAQAARFIYLNRTCFNGVFRVNRSGQFNVPYGRRATTLLPSLAHLTNISTALSHSRLQAANYEEALRHTRAGHFVYLDPPYPPLNGTSYFRHYTRDRFGDDDQRSLFEYFLELHSRRCLVMMSNADTALIRGLYSTFHITDLSTTRWISCKHKKHAVSELVITNYDVDESGPK